MAKVLFGPAAALEQTTTAPPPPGGRVLFGPEHDAQVTRLKAQEARLGIKDTNPDDVRTDSDLFSDPFSGGKPYSETLNRAMKPIVSSRAAPPPTPPTTTGRVLFGPGAGGGAAAPPPPRSGGAVFGPASGQSGSTAAPKVPGAPKKPSLLGQFTSIVKSVPSGGVHLVKDWASHDAVKIAMGALPGSPTFNPWALNTLRAHGGESQADKLRHDLPTLSGMVESAGRTAGDVRHPTHFAQASQQGTLASKVLEDVANASLVLGPVSRGAGAVAERTAAEAGAEGSAKAAAASGTARLLHGAAKATEAVASAPAKPWQLATTGIEAGPVLSRLPGVAAGDKVGLLPGVAKGFDKAAMSEGTTGQVLQRMKVDPQSRLLRREALTPAMDAQSEVVGQQVKLGQKVAGKLANPIEEDAMSVVGEGQAKTLAVHREQLGQAKFDEFVAHTFGDSLSPAAANLAADVASGKAPEAAARIDEALHVGSTSPGGRVERGQQYLAATEPTEPGKVNPRQWQFGYKADQAAIDKAIERPLRHVSKAEPVVRTLRERADAAAEALNAAKADASAALNEKAATTGERRLEGKRGALERGTTRAEQRAVSAADRLTSLQDMAEAAKVKPPKGTPLVERAQRRAGELVAANERVATGLDKGLATTVDRQASAAAAADRLTGVLNQAERSGGRLGQTVGAATERARQGGRLSRLETRNLGTLRTKLEGLPAEAEAAHVSPTYGMGKTLGRLETKASQTEALASRKEAQLGRMRERVRTTAEQTANSVGAAPARLRPAMEVNRAATSELADHAKTLRDQGLHDAAAKVDAAAAEIPTTLKAFAAAGIDPEHFIHVQGGDRPTAGGARTGGLPRTVKGREEKFRKDSIHFDRSVRAETQGEIDTAKNVIAKQTALKITNEMPFAKKVSDLGIDPAAKQDVIKAALKKAHYSPWDPRTPFETPSVVNADTVLLPDHIKNGFRSYFGSNAIDDILRKTYDRGIQGVKVGQLALSPSWQVNNIAGNVMLATLGAGIDPVTLAVAVKDAIKAYRASGPKGERDLEGTVPRRLLTAGPTHSEFAFLRPPNEEALGRFPRLQKAASVAGAPARAAYNLNSFVDNIGRSAVFIAKKGQGLSDEAAIKASLQAMGDFSRMTPMERMVVRRIIPYYAWSRHITQLAFRLPIEHPLRVAWTLHMADVYADPTTKDLPGSLAGAIRLPGGKLLESGRLFPFGDAGRVLEPNGIESQLSPFLKIPIQSRLGLNLGTGKPFSRPPGSGRKDAFGAQVPTAPSVPHQVGGLFPQKRLLDAITGRDRVARYDTGDKVLTAKGTIPTGKTSGLGALRFFGLPVTDAKQAEAMAKRVAEKQLANDKAKASYDKKKKAAGG